MREVPAKIRIVRFFAAYVEEVSILNGEKLPCKQCGVEVNECIRIVTYSSEAGLGFDWLCRDCYDRLEATTGDMAVKAVNTLDI
ncbi:MAG: hypothetical protein QW334_01620 [Thermofilum sp.]